MAGSVNVTIMYNDKPFKIDDLNESSCIFDLKKAIEQKTGVQTEFQNLLFDIQDLQDDIPLSFLDLSPEVPVLLLNDGPTHSPLGVDAHFPSTLASADQTWAAQSYSPPEPFQPFLSGTTRVSTNPTSFQQLTVADSLMPDDFRKLLDICEVDVDDFTQRFEQNYGTVHPLFHGGPFSEFYQQQCVVEKRVIFLSLHPSLPVPQDNFFKSHVLANQVLTNCFNMLSMPYWVGEVTLPIEQTFEQIFSTKLQYPFMALIANIGGSFNVLDFHNSGIIAKELIDKLERGHNNYRLIQEKQQRNEAILNAEREQIQDQNRRFQEAELRDTQAHRKKVDDEKIATITAASKRTALADARTDALLKGASLPVEPSPSQALPKPFKLGVRLPDGSKIDRYFVPTDLFQVVLDWVSFQVANRLTDDTFLDDRSPPLDGDQPVVPWTIDAYELVLNYPKKALSELHANTSLSQLGLGSQAMLFLQRKSEP